MEEYKTPHTQTLKNVIEAQKIQKKLKQDKINEQISGLTEQEQKVMDSICEGYAEFLSLETQHPSEMQDFVNAIHTLQGIFAMRVVRRSYPSYWLIHKSE